MTQVPTLTLNGKDHAISDLSEAARLQVANIQIVDAELTRLQQQVAIAQTARNAYMAALVAEVDAAPKAAPKTAAKKTAGKAKTTKG